MSKYKWTPQRTAALIALWNAEVSTSEIGRRLGITKNAVIGKVHRLGLAKRRPSPTQQADNGGDEFIRLEMLGTHMCRWPLGCPAEEGFRFCGESTVPGKPYCAKHLSVAYVRTDRLGGSSAALEKSRSAARMRII